LVVYAVGFFIIIKTYFFCMLPRPIATRATLWPHKLARLDKKRGSGDIGTGPETSR
jgi:hypothetical protein